MTLYKNGIPKNLKVVRHNALWIEVHDQSGSADNGYKSSKQIRFKTSMLRSDLCDFSNAYIVVKGEVTVTGVNNNSKKIDL